MPSLKAEAHAPIIQTKYGPVTGITETSHRDVHNKKPSPPILKFLGIPYAQASRFTRPEPPTPWTTPLPCVDFAPSFPQEHSPTWPLVHSRSGTGRNPSSWPQSEQAHVVNIWVPSDPPPQPDEKLPVFVWIYGGGLEHGSTEEPPYDGENFVRQRAKAGQRCLLISGNYRLNVFGWACGPGWAELDPQGKAGNYGLYDVRALLLWVQDNIAAFGGDPYCVTAFGESAGAWIISCLLTHPERLFDRAILHSGAPGTMPCRPPSSSYRPYKALCSRFCPGARIEAARLATLQALPASDLLAAHLAQPSTSNVGLTLETGPYAIWTSTAQQRLEEGHLSPWVKGILLGTLPDEGVPFAFTNPLCFQSLGVTKDLSRLPPAIQERAAQLFPSNPAAEASRDFTAAPVSRWLHEYLFAVPVDMLAEAITAKRTAPCPVFAWRFGTLVPGMQWGKSGRSNYGVPHAMELPAAFHIEKLLGEEGGPAHKAAEEMGRRWVQFGSTGDPGQDWPEWKGAPGTAKENGEWLVFRPDGSVGVEECPGFDERRAFVRGLLEDKEKGIARRWKEEKAAGQHGVGKAGKGSGKGGKGGEKL